MSVRPVFRGVVDRAFLLPNGQDGAAVRLADARLVSGMGGGAPRAGRPCIEVCHVGGDEWGVVEVAERVA
jgi:hypothetical protein